MTYDVLKSYGLSYNAVLLNRTESLLFITLRIQGVHLTALVDSGATRSFIGSKGIELIENLNFQVKENNSKVQFGNGHVEVVSKEMLLPIQLEEETREISVRVLDNAPFRLIVGLEFLRIIHIVSNFENRSWSFQSRPL